MNYYLVNITVFFEDTNEVSQMLVRADTEILAKNKCIDYLYKKYQDNVSFYVDVCEKLV